MKGFLLFCLAIIAALNIQAQDFKLSKGDQGEDVYKLQELLSRYNYAVGVEMQSKEFGPRTAEACAEFFGSKSIGQDEFDLVLFEDGLLALNNMLLEMNPEAACWPYALLNRGTKITGYLGNTKSKKTCKLENVSNLKVTTGMNAKGFCGIVYLATGEKIQYAPQITLTTQEHVDMVVQELETIIKLAQSPLVRKMSESVLLEVGKFPR